jgi:hypothetical protein
LLRDLRFQFSFPGEFSIGLPPHPTIIEVLEFDRVEHRTEFSYNYRLIFAKMIMQKN